MEDEKTILANTLQWVAEKFLFIMALFGVAGLKFLRSKMMGKQLTFMQQVYSACFTILTGFLCIPLVEDMPKTKSYLAIIMIAIASEKIVDRAVEKVPKWVNDALNYFSKDKDA